MDKIVKLNISERMFTIDLLNQFKGGYDSLAFVLEDSKQVAILEDDWKKADRRIETSKDENGKDITQWLWDDIKGGEKEIKFSESTAKYLSDKIEEKNKAGEFALKDKAVVTLAKKLKG